MPHGTGSAPESTSPVSFTTSLPYRRVALEAQPQRVVFDIQARTVIKLLALLLAFSVLVSLLQSVHTVLIWFGIAFFLAVALSPAVKFAERWMPRTTAVPVVFAAFLTGLVLVVVLLVGPFVTQVDNIVVAAPHAADHLAKNPLVHRLDQRYHLVAKIKAHASELPRIAFGAAGSIISGVTATVTVLFLTVFILFELPRMGEIVLAQFGPANAQRARRIGEHLNRSVGGYVAGNLLISAIAGVVVTVMLWILGVPYPLTLGVVVAIGDLIPLFGATLAAILVVAVAYFTKGTTDGVIVFVVILLYQQIENHVIQPLIYKRMVQIPSLVVLIAVLAGASVLGIIGALVAIPIAGTLQVVIMDILNERAESIAAANLESESVRATTI